MCVSAALLCLCVCSGLTVFVWFVCAFLRDAMWSVFVRCVCLCVCLNKVCLRVLARYCLV